MSVHPPIIIFDFDGVLLNSKGHLLAALEELRTPRKIWDPHLLDSLTALEIIRLFERGARERSVQSIKALSHEFHDFIPRRWHRIAFFLRYRRKVNKYEWEHSDFFPGVEDTLHYLDSIGVCLAGASNTFGFRVLGWLQQKKVEKLFPIFTTRDDRKIFGVKPNPRVILGVLSRLKRHYKWGRIQRNRVVFIGDNLTDIATAQLAKVKSIGVLSGHAYREELEMMMPDFLLQDITELPQILPQLFPDDFPELEITPITR